MKKLNYIKQISKTLTNNFYRQPKALPRKVVDLTELRGGLDYAFSKFKDKDIQTYEWVENEPDWEKIGHVAVPHQVARIQERQHQSKIIQMAQASNSWFGFKK